MQLYGTETDVEKILSDKADIEKIPIGGTIELLPLCNMNCKMCYIVLSKEEMEEQGRMLSCDEWLRILGEAEKLDTLYLLITGGEPLIYPEFKKLYSELKKRGFILSVNTNGTLIDEDWADFFVQYGVRRINITLYGKNDETYYKLCKNPKGFTQVMKGARLLKERNVPFRFTCSATPYNEADLPEIYGIAKEFDVPLDVATYMFPAVRRGEKSNLVERFKPEVAGRLAIEQYRMRNPEKDMKQACRNTLECIKRPPKLTKSKGFNCHAGHSGFWMNWKGELLPCGMFKEPCISMLDHSFEECWKYIVEETHKIKNCSKCEKCGWQNICQVCPAVCYTETGKTDGYPEYVCRMTCEMLRQMEKYI